jgi:hypothetical protein
LLSSCVEVSNNLKSRSKTRLAPLFASFASDTGNMIIRNFLHPRFLTLHYSTRAFSRSKGTGKSTLMKETRGRATSSSVVMLFFFNARGTSTKNQLLGSSEHRSCQDKHDPVLEEVQVLDPRRRGHYPTAAIRGLF